VYVHQPLWEGSFNPSVSKGFDLIVLQTPARQLLLVIGPKIPSLRLSQKSKRTLFFSWFCETNGQ